MLVAGIKYSQVLISKPMVNMWCNETKQKKKLGRYIRMEKKFFEHPNDIIYFLN